MKGFGLLLGAALLAPLPADASFEQCDGYPTPGKKSDGITRTGGFLGIGTRTADHRRDQRTAGTRGIAACNAALTSPALLDIHWLRRGHLLQARAFHELASGLPEDALKSLDQSDAIGTAHQDSLFASSVGLGNQALRSMALFRLKRPEEAEKALVAIETARPYAISLRALTRGIRLSFDPSLDKHMAALRGDSVLSPSLLHLMFWFSLFNSDHQAALAYSGEVSFALPRNRGAWVMEGAATYAYELIENRARMDGAVAYVLLALGRNEEAQARLGAARQDLEDASTPPVPNPKTGKIKKAVQAEYNLRIAAVRKARAELDIWERAMQLRTRVPGMPLEEAIQLLGEGENRDLPVIVDLLRQIKTNNPIDAANVKDAVDQIAGQLDKVRIRELGFDEFELAKALPRPEIETMRPVMARIGLTFFVGDGMKGFTVKESKDTGLVDVSFGSDTATSALVEEAAFLAAASHVRNKGKDAFVIVSSQLLQRTTNVYSGYGYSLNSSYPSGYELRMTIRPVASTALPADLAKSGWRLVKVADIYANLGTKFPAPRR